jgi:hypothetical protein
VEISRGGGVIIMQNSLIRVHVLSEYVLFVHIFNGASRNETPYLKKNMCMLTIVCVFPSSEMSLCLVFLCCLRAVFAPAGCILLWQDLHANKVVLCILCFVHSSR